jgi:hypothetical protein
MDSTKKPNAGANSSQTGVDNETYDLMVTLTNKLQELWRLDEFIADEKGHPRDREVWATLQKHDREDVQALLQALKRQLGGQG